MTSMTATRYYIRDPRQQSLQGKREGGWLKQPPAPALWVKRRDLARAFTLEEIQALQAAWPYFDGCEMVPAET